MFPLLFLTPHWLLGKMSSEKVRTRLRTIFSVLDKWEIPRQFPQTLQSLLWKMVTISASFESDGTSSFCQICKRLVGGGLFSRGCSPCLVNSRGNFIRPRHSKGSDGRAQLRKHLGRVGRYPLTHRVLCPSLKKSDVAMESIETVREVFFHLARISWVS